MHPLPPPELGVEEPRDKWWEIHLLEKLLNEMTLCLESSPDKLGWGCSCPALKSCLTHLFLSQLSSSSSHIEFAFPKRIYPKTRPLILLPQLGCPSPSVSSPCGRPLSLVPFSEFTPFQPLRTNSLKALKACQCSTWQSQ